MLNKKCGHIHDTIVVALFVLDGGCIGDMTNATTFKILHKRYIFTPYYYTQCLYDVYNI